MRHQRSGKKLGRDSAHRKALYSNLAGALIEHGRIKTTVTKAKAVRPYAEQMITLGRRGGARDRGRGRRGPGGRRRGGCRGRPDGGTGGRRRAGRRRGA